jgi:hypothetical protein
MNAVAPIRSIAFAGLYSVVLWWYERHAQTRSAWPVVVVSVLAPFIIGALAEMLVGLTVLESLIAIAPIWVGCAFLILAGPGLVIAYWVLPFAALALVSSFSGRALVKVINAKLRKK